MSPPALVSRVPVTFIVIFPVTVRLLPFKSRVPSIVRSLQVSGSTSVNVFPAVI